MSWFRSIRRRGDNRGFTLIELMVVIVIIGILTSMAQPNFVKMRKRAEAAAALGDLEAVRAAVLSYNAQTSKWPRGRSAGRIPPEIRDHLPAGFSFRKPKYQIDYDYYRNSSYYQFAVGVRTTDKEFGRTVISLLSNAKTQQRGRRYMWLF